jgi:gamma-glutamyltranspeptidase/glutathione hydrolase
LATTLKRIAKNGAAEFYRGETARMLADKKKKNGGLITLEDLPTTAESAEVCMPNTRTAGTTGVLTAPPPIPVVSR